MPSAPRSAKQSTARQQLSVIRSASRYQFDPDVNFYAILGFRVVLGKAVAER